MTPPTYEQVLAGELEELARERVYKRGEYRTLMEAARAQHEERGSET